MPSRAESRSHPAHPAHPVLPGHDAARHYGKYRGTVSDNQDPRNQGRLKAQVPELLGDVDSGWALPCVPYAGDGSGSYAVPAVGAGVWMEFEAGHLSRPIWSGCWWPSDSLPQDEAGTAATPDVRMIRSEEGLLLALHDDSKTIALSDSDGSNLLTIEVDDGKVTITASSKVVIDAPAIELASGASSAAVLGDKLKSYLGDLVQSLNSHMHSGQMAGSIPVVGAPPASPLQTPSSDLLSTVVKLS